MVIDYDVKSKVEVEVYEDYDCDGHPKYANDNNIDYDVTNVEIAGSKIRMNIVRKYADKTPNEYEHDDGEVTMMIQKYITSHTIVIDKRDFDTALKTGELTKAKVENCTQFNQEMISTDVVSGPMLTEDQAEEIFEYIDDIIVDNTILLAASVE